MNKDLIIKRLSIAKHIYNNGVEQSHLPESIAFSSILSFHDAVEFFLKLAAEKNNVKSDSLGFIEYWDKIPSLNLKESMKTLNRIRVNLKHRGILPPIAEVDRCRVYVTDFFNHNSMVQFEVDFSKISLSAMINNSDTMDYISKAEDFLQKGLFKECV